MSSKFVDARVFFDAKDCNNTKTFGVETKIQGFRDFDLSGRATVRIALDVRGAAGNSECQQSRAWAKSEKSLDIAFPGDVYSSSSPVRAPRGCHFKNSRIAHNR